MSKTILRDCEITVDGVDLSDHASSVEISEEKNDVDLTAFGANNKVHGVGLGDASMKINFFQDFDAGSVDATLAPIFAAGEPVPVVVIPDGGAGVSATNPRRTMQGLMMNYSALAGSVGEASKTDVTFTNGDDSGIVRTEA